MTKDDVIRMAREAGGGLSCIAEPLEHPWKFSEVELIRFARLVAAHEREECAKVCERTYEIRAEMGLTSGFNAIMQCADAIRQRGSAD